MTVSSETFIGAIFDGLEPDEYVLLACQKNKSNGQDPYFAHAPWSQRRVEMWGRGRLVGGIFFNVSTVKAPAPGEKWRRRQQDCVCSYVVVLDDIGTKVSEHPPIEPSYKIETSKGNYQWGYIIEPYDDLGRYESIVEGLGELGFTDKGAGGYNRLMRIPGSVNTKLGRDNFISTVTEWEPKRIFDLEKLAVDLGVDLNNLGVKKQPTASRANGNLPNVSILDPLEIWLNDNKHVVDDTGGDFITIKCPWGDAHTTGEDTAGYSPLGRGDGEWVERRGFKCLHEHCVAQHFAEFRDWAVARGGPDVAGVDPLPWLKDRYTFVASGKEIADMYQRQYGGTWRYGLEEWSMANYRRIYHPDHDRPVLIKTAFLEHPDTRKADALAYVPTAEGFTTLFEQPVVNTYVEPTHLETDQEPKIFLEHMAYLLGDNKDLFLDWLAYKIQKPSRRSYAIVMVADNAFGTGRSWIRAMLDRALQGKVNSGNLSQLIGKGTSGENNFNDWGAECQFLVVEEAKDMDPSDFYKSYETFKQRIDTRPVAFRCNPKYGKTRDDFMYFNCLIFTNHSDAMIIPEADRRICVLENPDERKDYAYYDRLEAALDSDEPQKVYWYLKRRDISEFDHVYPPMTDAKLKMIDQSKSPIDDVMDMALEKLTGDIITKKVLSKALRAAARELEYAKLESEPGYMVARLWRKIGRLRPEDKNGARYTLNSKQDELRAIRNREKWIEVDRGRNEKALVDELNLNMEEAFSATNFPK